MARLPLIRLLLLLLLAGSMRVYGQWGAPYTNSWITYGQPYAKIGVTQKGIQKVSFSSLPSGFSVDQQAKFQLWHRGRQVAILSTSNNEILFYGVPNDGALDSLLYRPMSSRMNPYTSLYSDESAYYLTIGKENGLRATVVNQNPTAITPSTYHKKTDVTSFAKEYSLSTTSAIRANFFNSFFENGASKTGETIKDGLPRNYNFQLTNMSADSKDKAVIKLMVHGRSNAVHSIEVYVGKDDKSLRKVDAIKNENFTASVYSFEVQDTDVDANKKGILSLKGLSSDIRPWYSLAYYTVTYPRTLNMGTSKSYEFTFDKTTDTWTRVNIANTPTSCNFYDISDIDVPQIITGKATDLMIPRKTGKSVKLLATAETIAVPAAKIISVSLTKLDPKAYNYIIVTTDALKEGANTYASYRASAIGGSFKPVVVTIKDVYNQFNFGEPSPVAIRRFMDYMLSDGNTAKNLFLIGKSVTFNERMTKELPDEVPTIGFPGSDVLLVEGLAGTPKEVPAVPVGRLSALTNQHIYDYLEKVKEYEAQSANGVSWKKNILHLNGGKSTSEITQLKNILAELAPMAEEGFAGAKVKAFVKPQPIAETISVNITPEINSGVGLLTYFGHGSTTVTDLDIGYITDASRAYSNQGRYPLMYFNGCGVGNVFSGRFNTSPSSGDRMALSLNWILAPKRGTVAVVANTFDTYVSTTTDYLEHLYTVLFVDNTTSKLPIGEVQKEVARRTFAKGYNSYLVANVHQALLQGDPALHMIYVASPDYSVDSDEGIMLYAENSGTTIGKSANLVTAITVENQGRYNKGEQVPVQIKYVYGDGTQVVKNETMLSFPYLDTIKVTSPSKAGLLRVEVVIDPAGKVTELSKSNNSSELLVEWDKAKDQAAYPIERVKDVIPPILNVTFNGRVIENEEETWAKPDIRFVLTDDRLMSMDSSLISIFIKKCPDNDCDFEELSYSDLEMKQLSDRSVEVIYHSELAAEGLYEILVNTKDKAGNASESPFSIKFRIGDADALSVVTSPNPATDYVRFRIKGNGSGSLKSAEVTIFDLKGNKRLTHEMRPTASTEDWYWMPTGAGLFIYNVTLRSSDGKEKKITGKVAVVK